MIMCFRAHTVPQRAPRERMGSPSWRPTTQHESQGPGKGGDRFISRTLLKGAVGGARGRREGEGGGVRG